MLLIVATVRCLLFLLVHRDAQEEAALAHSRLMQTAGILIRFLVVCLLLLARVLLVVAVPVLAFFIQYLTSRVLSIYGKRYHAMCI
jgi:hypothetical protein